MKQSFIIPLLFCLSACRSAYSPRLGTMIGAVLPQNNGYFSYVQADILPGVTMPEINRVAQVWIREHTTKYAFAWQPPVYKAELLYSGQSRPERIPLPASEYYAKRTVQYYLTVSATTGSYRLMLTNFEVAGIGRKPIGLEKLVSDQALCRAVEGEATTLLETMSGYIRHNANKPL